MDYEDPNRKHFRADSSSEDDVPRFTLEAMASLPLLPDDVLLCIMKYLGPVELHNLSKYVLFWPVFLLYHVCKS
jgi:hypothetical protein